MKIETEEIVTTATEEYVVVEPGDIVEWIEDGSRYLVSDHDTWIELYRDGTVEDLAVRSTSRRWKADKLPFRVLT